MWRGRGTIGILYVIVRGAEQKCHNQISVTPQWNELPSVVLESDGYIINPVASDAMVHFLGWSKLKDGRGSLVNVKLMDDVRSSIINIAALDDITRDQNVEVFDERDVFVGEDELTAWRGVYCAREPQQRAHRSLDVKV